MKIIRHHPKRRHNLPLTIDPTELVVDQPCQKRALLIGINNTLMADGGSKSELKLPHQDVLKMKDLLIEKYQYNVNDVVTLIDIDHPKALQPTRDNIIAEMKNLVADARRGDRFFFHYSGHVVQIDNEDHTEEDGKDECLVPCDSDGFNKLILDDVLRDILVDRLPQGCQLVAVLDSCHSASLLDLEHFRCNRVWVPWVSKGRRKSDTILSNVRRHNALVVYQNKRISGDRVKQRKTTVHPSPRSPLSPERLEQFRDIPAAPSSPVDPPVMSPTSTSTQKKLARALTKLDLNAGRGLHALRGHPTRKESAELKSSSSKIIKSQFIPWLDGEKIGMAFVDEDTELRQCESPVQEFCSGWCAARPQPLTSPGSSGSPDILSLASCKDSQEAWEDGEGHSMTQMLVEILKKDPHPTLRDLMVTVSHKLHNAALQAHTETKKYKKKMVTYRRRHPEKPKPRSIGDTDGLNLNAFQDPQLSSAKPLDMGKRWNL
ncbi:hypothetical protein D9757_004112 [Collybiopsis confluens]|uniref:Peptidase C14 caspase domain-containing protein n=1 Tax=Collybiopsis confluens TaxID=2823264 RepID=A0A8H5HU72_9AGAR|nr:hypothetical protein D9757_004112 [Collybiopsis confluens]